MPSRNMGPVALILRQMFFRNRRQIFGSVSRLAPSWNPLKSKKGLSL